MEERQISQAETHTDWGTIATLLGVSTAGVIFVAFYGAWSFGRGLFLELNFPPSAISLKGALDLFPQVGITYTATFCFFLFIGFIIPAVGQKRLQRRNSLIFVALALLLIISFLTTLEVRNIYFRVVVIIAAMFGPIVVGPIYSSQNKRSIKVFAILLAISTFLSIYSFHLYWYGREEADKITSLRNAPFSDHGMAASKLEEYPFVTIITKEKLCINTQPEERGGAFVYAPSANSFVRIVFSDSDRHYFVERSGGDVISFTVSKSKVEQIVFHRLDLSK